MQSLKVDSKSYFDIVSLSMCDLSLAKGIKCCQSRSRLKSYFDLYTSPDLVQRKKEQDCAMWAGNKRHPTRIYRRNESPTTSRWRPLLSQRESKASDSRKSSLQLLKGRQHGSRGSLELFMFSTIVALKIVRRQSVFLYWNAPNTSHKSHSW